MEGGRGAICFLFRRVNFIVLQEKVLFLISFLLRGVRGVLYIMFHMSHPYNCLVHEFQKPLNVIVICGSLQPCRIVINTDDLLLYILFLFKRFEHNLKSTLES